MEQDSIILINKDIDPFLITQQKSTQINFFNYTDIYETLCQKRAKSLKIYDITYNPKLLHHTIIPINDHINRIGSNPFIGKQKFYNIDFINVEQIYSANPQGVVTTSYGTRYEEHKTTTPYPSTHIANIAALAHIQSYKIQGYLVNQLS